MVVGAYAAAQIGGGDSPAGMLGSLAGGSRAARTAHRLLEGVRPSRLVSRRPPPCSRNSTPRDFRDAQRLRADRMLQVERSFCPACGAERRVLRGTYIYVAPRHRHERAGR